VAGPRSGEPCSAGVSGGAGRGRLGAATPDVPKFISRADPASRWTGANGGLAFFAYCANYLVDLKHAVIVDVEVTTAVRQAEVTAQQRMIDRAWERFGLWPERLSADTAYRSAENLAWLVHERGIEPHIPIFDKSQRSDGTFSRDDFIYAHASDTYRCPGGKTLQRYRGQFTTPRTGIMKDNSLRYRASKRDCLRVPTETAMLPECACPQDPALDPCRRPRYGARRRDHRRLCHLAARTQEGRNAIRPSQAHFKARPAPITRAERRTRRVPSRRYRSEPPQAG
jgi:hypothetical protein